MNQIVRYVINMLQCGNAACIELPRVGLTLLPPWGYAIMRKNKRCENRVPSVAGRVRNWRGMVALSHSATWKKCDYNDAIDHLVSLHMFDRTDVQACKDWSDRMAGKVFAAAELVDVRPNGPMPNDAWAVPGEHGLWFEHVLEVEPVACTGGRGVFRFGGCEHCGRPHAHERDKDIKCTACKKTTEFANITHPKINIKAAIDNYGRLVAGAS